MTLVVPTQPYQFLEAEELALKAKLTGLTVADAKNAARPVGCWFRSPDREFSQTSFPFIAISFTGLSIETDRSESFNIDVMNYLPDRVPGDPANKYFAPYPIPVSLSFVIEAHSRNPRHDLQLLQRLLEPDKLPLKFGWLEVTADNTIRRLDHVGWQQADFFDSDGKRTLRKLIVVTVSAEMLPRQAWTEEYAASVVLKVTNTVNVL